MVQFKEQATSLRGGLLKAKGSYPVYVSVSRFLHYPSVPGCPWRIVWNLATHNLESSHINITPGRPQTDEDETKGRTKQTAHKSAPASENKCKKMCPSGPSGKECRDQCDESDFLDACERYCPKDTECHCNGSKDEMRDFIYDMEDFLDAMYDIEEYWA